MSGLPVLSRFTLQTNNFADWTRSVRERLILLDLEHRSMREFQAEMDVLPLGGSTIAKVATTASKVERTRHAINTSACDHVFKLVWQLQGTGEMEQQGRSATLTPGKMAIYRMDQPYELSASDDYRILLFSTNLSDQPEWRSLAEKFSGKELPIDGMARAAMAASASLLDSTSGAGLQAAINPICDLVFQSLWQTAHQTAGGADLRTRRLHDARQIVHAHLSDSGFGPAQLANKLGVSRRSLYQAFQQCGFSPADFILSERLEFCHRALTNGRTMRWTVTEIAFAHGFSDSSHFSRVFRQRYGTSPNKLRQQTLNKE